MSGRTSGYWRVTFGEKKLRKVVAMPLAMPEPGIGIRSFLLASQVEYHNLDGRDEQVDERQREQHLPGNAHELVDADARQRRAQPDGHEHEQVRLQEEPQDAPQRPGKTAELRGEGPRRQVASEEKADQDAA